MLDINTIHQYDALTGLRLLPDESVNICVTSQPYYGLRDYGFPGQIGLEKTPEEYIQALVEVLREVKRVLKYDGTLWVNIGDSYAGGGRDGNNPDNYSKHKMFGKTGWDASVMGKPLKVPKGVKPKDLIGTPWMLAFALRADGWYLRQDIIWSKPNPMPESVTDRCTKSHEYIFLFSKSAKYFYDATSIRTTAKPHSLNKSHFSDGTKKNCKIRQRGYNNHAGFNEKWDKMTVEEQRSMGANKRSVWHIATRPFKGAHFATFPIELPKTCILAGCPENGIVLDPFMGAATTALAARLINRNFIGFEPNPEYKKIGDERLAKELGLFI